MSHFLSITSRCFPLFSLFFFFNDPATTEIYTLSLHDALPICLGLSTYPFNNAFRVASSEVFFGRIGTHFGETSFYFRSEEHTSELQSHVNLVCRLLLEKKKKKILNQKLNTNNMLIIIYQHSDY